MLYLILFSWWFPGNPLMLIWLWVFTQPSNITQSYHFAWRKKEQGLVSSKEGRLMQLFMMNHKEKKIQSLLIERKSKPWVALAQGSAGSLKFHRHIWNSALWSWDTSWFCSHCAGGITKPLWTKRSSRESKFRAWSDHKFPPGQIMVGGQAPDLQLR